MNKKPSFFQGFKETYQGLKEGGENCNTLLLYRGHPKLRRENITPSIVECIEVTDHSRGGCCFRYFTRLNILAMKLILLRLLYQECIIT